MSLTIQTEPVPLYADKHGVLRMRESRVTLDVVIQAYEGGADPEAIVHAYDTLHLADVYAVIAYYLRHEEEVKGYLRQREIEAEALEKEIQPAQPVEKDLRAKLLARRVQMRSENASSRD